MGIHDAQLNCQDGGHDFIAIFFAAAYESSTADFALVRQCI